MLAGYSYAHFGGAWLGTRRQLLLHLLLVFCALSFLPVTLPMHWLTMSESNPVGLVLAVLTVSIGLPFLLLSAGAPLIQKWFAEGRPSHARDPYFLYAASNAGSLAGLLAYPLLLEINFTLSQQNQLWLFGYLSLLGLLSLCGWHFLRASSGADSVIPAAGAQPDLLSNDAIAVTLSRRLRWVLWSFVPSSLLLGVTSYATTDVASAPLFWVVPLTAYLLSFIVAFARPSWAVNSVLVRFQALLLLGSISTIFVSATQPVRYILPLHLVGFFVTSLICHGQLSKDRPEARSLTDFYLWISVGGVLGGVFNALIAPVIFTGVSEYPLAIAAAAFLRPCLGDPQDSHLSRRLDWFLPLALVGAIVAIAVVLKNAAILTTGNDGVFICGVSAAALLAFVHRPRRFGVGVSALIFLSLWYPSAAGELLYADRSFFGSYRAMLQVAGNRHVLFQGTTVHGAQNRAPEMLQQPLTYFHRSGPAGQVLRSFAKSHREGRVGIVGLGTGALACHGSAGQSYTFYEIDPMVERIARDDKLFSA